VRGALPPGAGGLGKDGAGKVYYRWRPFDRLRGAPSEVEGRAKSRGDTFRVVPSKAEGRDEAPRSMARRGRKARTRRATLLLP
jgi:hypothetical protein